MFSHSTLLQLAVSSRKEFMPLFCTPIFATAIRGHLALVVSGAHTCGCHKTVTKRERILLQLQTAEHSKMLQTHEFSFSVQKACKLIITFTAWQASNKTHIQGLIANLFRGLEGRCHLCAFSLPPSSIFSRGAPTCVWCHGFSSCCTEGTS